MSDLKTSHRPGLRFGLRTLFVVVALFGGCLAAPIAYVKHRYPYGMSHCCDKQLGLALMNYAQTNGGRFPSGGATPEASLSLLYPALVDANVLRGKTVPLDAAERLLLAGKMLTPDTCGWHYVDGLTLPRNGGSRIAILWDKIGLDHNGGRLPYGGHSVVFMDGHGQVIREADWDRFIAEQQTAWDVIRQGGQPTQPWVPDYW